jgi:hypothetical protein
MAKGQKRSNKETRKPKQAKPKPAASAPGSLLSGLHQPPSPAPAPRR